MSLATRIAHRSVRELIRLACLLGLVALAIMAYSVIDPTPLPVILAMSVGHVIGLAAAGCYVLAVIVDAARVKAPASTAARAESATPPDKL